MKQPLNIKFIEGLLNQKYTGTIEITGVSFADMAAKPKLISDANFEQYLWSTLKTALKVYSKPLTLIIPVDLYTKFQLQNWNISPSVKVTAPLPAAPAVPTMPGIQSTRFPITEHFMKRSRTTKDLLDLAHLMSQTKDQKADSAQEQSSSGPVYN